MTHNDVARRTAATMPARSVTPRALACDGQSPSDGPTARSLVRQLPLRALSRAETDGS